MKTDNKNMTKAIGVRMTEAEYKALYDMAYSRRITVSGLIRKLIAEEVKKHV